MKITSNSRQVAMLAALFLGTFMALLDVSIVTIALPAIQTDLDASLADLQWVVDGLRHALLTAGLLTGAVTVAFAVGTATHGRVTTGQPRTRQDVTA